MTSLGEALILTLYVGAARASCTPEEAVLLRQGLLGPLEDYQAGRCDESDIIDLVDRIMPDGWKPTGEWADQLESLGFTRGRLGK